MADVDMPIFSAKRRGSILDEPLLAKTTTTTISAPNLMTRADYLREQKVLNYAHARRMFQHELDRQNILGRAVRVSPQRKLNAAQIAAIQAAAEAEYVPTPYARGLNVPVPPVRGVALGVPIPPPRYSLGTQNKSTPSVKNFSGSEVYRMRNPQVCTVRKDIKSYVKTVRQQAYNQVARTAPDVLCARSRTTQAKLAIRGKQAELADSARCQQKYAILAQARSVGSKAQSEAYQAGLAAASIPAYLRCA